MRSIGAALVLLMSGTVGLAQDAPLIGPATLTVFPRGEERCFAGTFDAAYRGSHAGQTLAQFWLYRHFQRNQAKEEPGPTPAKWIAEDIKPPRPVGQCLGAAVLVALVDLVPGLARYPELNTQLRVASPSWRQAMKRRRSSIPELSFHGIHTSRHCQKRQKV